MRVVLALVTLALVLLAAPAAAFGPAAKAALAKRRAMTGSADPNPDLREQGYRLLVQYMLAVQAKNWTAAGNLLADDGFFVVSDVACGMLDKSALLGWAMSSNTSAIQLSLGSWVETLEGLTVIKAEEAALFNRGSIQENITYHNRAVWLLAMPTADGKQLMMIERWTDRSWAQPLNATQIMGVWAQVESTFVARSLATWDRLITPDFQFTLGYQWDMRPPLHGNRTEFLASMAHFYSIAAATATKVGDAFPVCDFALADAMLYVTYTDGTAQIAKVFIAVSLDDSMNVQGFAEYYMGLFLPIDKR